ncbi:9352_t:CDS:2 [Rhizophagus irregularis]|nr:9352_t:CDS:2 [Rhizophagus irregularis]
MNGKKDREKETEHGERIEIRKKEKRGDQTTQTKRKEKTIKGQIDTRDREATEADMRRRRTQMEGEIRAARKEQSFNTKKFSITGIEK